MMLGQIGGWTLFGTFGAEALVAVAGGFSLIVKLIALPFGGVKWSFWKALTRLVVGGVSATAMLKVSEDAEEYTVPVTLVTVGPVAAVAGLRGHWLALSVLASIAGVVWGLIQLSMPTSADA